MIERDPLVDIRRAHKADGPEVRRIVFESFVEYGIIADPDGKDSDVMHFGEHGDAFDEFVAVADGVPIGSIMIAPHGERGGWLSKFFVDARFRGRGIGRRLLERAVEAARARGYRDLRLDTRSAMKEAIHLYEATGWRLDPGPHEDGPCDAFYIFDL